MDARSRGVVDPRSVTSREEFGDALTAVRVAAGLRIREVADMSGGYPGTVGSWFAGHHAPTAASHKAFESLLRVMGVREPAELALWWDAAQRVRARGRHDTDAAPYKGLEAFGTEDAPVFCGRERTTRAVVAEVLAARDDGSRQVLVVGPSGVGKSSLVRAGVVPALVASGRPLDGRDVLILTPGRDPVGSLQAALTDARRPVLLVVDQLEELFTQAIEPAGLLPVIARLAAEEDLLAILVLRSDYFTDAARQPALFSLLAAHQVVVGPMDSGELREAITEPARRAGRQLEPELVDALLAGPDPRGGLTGAEQGSLPLLSHALLATWSASPPGRVTLAAYRETGSVEGAVAQTAEQVYASLPPALRTTARRVFLRLVALDGAVIARRAAAPRELVTEADPDGPAEVTERFAAARLLTLGDDSVAVSHEALLEHWPRLRGWIAQYRDDAAVHQRIAAATVVWLDADRAPEYLPRGARQAQFAEWAADPEHAIYLNVGERELLNESAREQTATRDRARRRSRRLTRLTGAAVVFGVLALVLALVAVFAVGRADRQQAAAVQARDNAVAVQLAQQSASLRARDPNLAAQLALAAYRTDSSSTATSALLDTSAGPVPNRLTGAAGPMAVAATADGSLLAAARSDGSVSLAQLDLATGVMREVSRVDAATGSPSLYAAALDPAGRLLAVAGQGYLVRLFDISDPAAPRAIGEGLAKGDGACKHLAFSSAGTQLAAASSDGSVHRWSIGADRAVSPLPAVMETGPVNTAAFGRDGATLFTGASDGTVKAWDVAGDRGPTLRSSTFIGSATNFVLSLAVSPDGATVALGAKDGVVRQLDVTDPVTPVLSSSTLGGLTSYVNAVDFSEDGRRVLGGSSDDRIMVWDRESGATTATLEGPASVTGTVFGGRSRYIVAASDDGVLRAWPLSQAPLAGARATVFSATFSDDGSVLAAGPGKADGRVLLWDTRDPLAPHRLTDLVPPPGTTLDGSSTISPDANLAVGGTATGGLVLWDLRDRAAPRVIGTPVETGLGLAQVLTISRDGRFLAATFDPGNVLVWDISDPAGPVPTAALETPAALLDVKISPDGRTLAVTAGDNTVRLWNLAAPGGPAELPTLGGFSNTGSTVAFSADSSRLVAGSYDRTLQIWDVSNPGAARILARVTGPSGGIEKTTWNAAGTGIAAAVDDGTEWVWDIAPDGTATVRATLEAAAGGQLFATAFHPLDDVVVGFGSGSAQAGRVWNVDPDEVARQICATVGTPITEAEWSTYAVGVPFAPPCR